MSENDLRPNNPTSRTPPGPERSSGDQAADAVRSVLEDQVQRRERQKEASRRREKKRLLPLPVVALLWGAACLLVWVATPQFLLPEPLPEPSVQDLEAGLRLEMVALVAQIDGYRGETGRVPDTLERITAYPPDGIRYSALPPDSYLLTGSRGAAEVVYQAGEPLQELLGDARERIRNAGGGAE